MICAFRMRTQEGIGGLMMSGRPGKSEQAAARVPRLDRRADKPLESGTGMLPGVRCHHEADAGPPEHCVLMPTEGFSRAWRPGIEIGPVGLKTGFV